MSERFLVPNEDAVSEILGMLYGDEPEVGAVGNAAPDGRFGATFLDDNDQLVAACTSDIDFVAYSGAALSMIPADVAKETIADGELTDMMFANFYEVMNICSKLFMSDSSDHLRLDKTFRPADTAGAVGSLVGAANEATFSVGIPKYGAGTLSFYVV